MQARLLTFGRCLVFGTVEYVDKMIKSLKSCRTLCTSMIWMEHVSLIRNTGVDRYKRRAALEYEVSNAALSSYALST
jgi:hypothetical protein